MSVILPVYNEEGIIGDTVRKVHRALDDRKIDHEIVVVDDGSSDGTMDVLRRLQKGDDRLVVEGYPVNRGKGRAVHVGVAACSKPTVLVLDADLSIPVEEIDGTWEWFDRGYDGVIGSKKLPGSDWVAGQPLARKILGKGFTWLSNILMGTHYSDITCGFKIFRSDKARPVFAAQRLARWGYDSEILFLFFHRGCRFREFPVRLVENRASRVRLFRDTFGSFVELMIIWWNALTGAYPAGRRSG